MKLLSIQYMRLMKLKKAKVLILHGYQDPVSPMSELLQFQKEMAQDKVNWQTHLYGQAVHAFATPSAQDPSEGILYNAAAAKQAEREIDIDIIVAHR